MPAAPSNSYTMRARKHLETFAPFRTRLKALRLERGLSQETLAYEMHTHTSTISRLESGQRLPTTAMLIDLAEFFGTSVPELVEGVAVNRGTELPRARQTQIEDSQVALSIRKLAQVIGVSRQDVETFWWSNDFPKFKVGNRYYVMPADAQEFFKRRKIRIGA